MIKNTIHMNFPHQATKIQKANKPTNRVEIKQNIILNITKHSKHLQNLSYSWV